MNTHVAITGGAGCIGGAIAELSHARGCDVTILDRNESALFWSEQRRPWAVHQICDVANPMAEIDADVVIHAAAYKHVPLMEREPWEAIRNNVIGTQHVLEAARHCRQFVLVSTDKACGRSLMGRTKWMAERLALAQGRHAIRLVNVLGSPGSVLDVWKQQADAGEPLTITHPEAQRYWTTAEHAAECCLGVLDLPAGLYTFNPERSVSVGELRRIYFPQHAERITGMRPGEILVEQLVEQGETIEATSNERIGAVRSGAA